MLGVVASSVLPAPLVTLLSTTNFNQNRATLRALVNGQGLSTNVLVEYSNNGGSTWTGLSAMVGAPLYSSAELYKNVTGLSNATAHIVKVTATNVKQTVVVQNSNGNFTTWELKTFSQIVSGAFSVTVPTITPTGEATIAPVITEMLLYGGGGGANYGGGGGGGYRIFSSHTSSVAGTTTISGSVGVGGAAGNGGTGIGTATAGGSTTLTIGSTTWTGGGGTAGEHPGANSAPSGRGGTAGSGDNASNLGGTNAYGYYYVSGYVYVCTQYDKYGINCTAGYYDYNQPIYSWDANYYACGGGGGTNAGGSNATGHSTNVQVGGAGGGGGGAYGLRGGNGGGGTGTQGNGAAGGFSVGSGTIVGSGGSYFGAGLPGGVTFKYYAPVTP